MALLTGDWSKRPLCPDGQRQIIFKIDDDGQSGSWTCGIRLNHWEPHHRQPASHFTGPCEQPDVTGAVFDTDAVDGPDYNARVC
jgi:hypothetical protein